MGEHPLFRPFSHEKINLPNRIVMAPMARNFSPDFVPDEKVAAYYARRAEGGAGLLITEACWINHPVASTFKRQAAMFGAALPGWQRVCERVHDAGGRIFAQIWHIGAERQEGGIPYPHLPALSPSGLAWNDRPSGEAMTEDDIEDTIAAFAGAAVNARNVGFDGVEVHGAHGYLIDQFICGITNRRTDRWGGSLENRMRYPVEVLRRVRAAVGEDFPISFRLSQFKLQDYDARIADTPEELALILEHLSAAGADFFHSSTRRFWEPAFPGSDLNLAGWTKKLTGKPAITVGSVGLDSDFVTNEHSGSRRTRGNAAVSENLDRLAERMEREEFDLVAVGRSIIANPDWPKLVAGNRIPQLRAYDRNMLRTLH